MFKKIASTFSLALICASSASAQSSSALPAEITPLQDTQVYLSDISSIGIELSSDNIRHRVIGKATFADSRCGTQGSRCVGLPAPQSAVLIADETASVPQTSSLGVFGVCRRVIESAKPTDRFVLRGNFERWQYRTPGVPDSRTELRIKRLASCFNYRATPEPAPLVTTK
jgi:hypothetical protein